MPKITEIERIYHFANNQTITIPLVRKLEVSKNSGNHRIITKDRKLHIVPNTWLHIEITSKKGWEM